MAVQVLLLNALGVIKKSSLNDRSTVYAGRISGATNTAINGRLVALKYKGTDSAGQHMYEFCQGELTTYAGVLTESNIAQSHVSSKFLSVPEMNGSSMCIDIQDSRLNVVINGVNVPNTLYYLKAGIISNSSADFTMAYNPKSDVAMDGLLAVGYTGGDIETIYNLDLGNKDGLIGSYLPQPVNTSGAKAGVNENGVVNTAGLKVGTGDTYDGVKAFLSTDTDDSGNKLGFIGSVRKNITAFGWVNAGIEAITNETLCTVGSLVGINQVVGMVAPNILPPVVGTSEQKPWLWEYKK